MATLGVRPDLVGVDPYVSPQRPGWKGVRLNTNESPYPPPTALVEQVTEGLRAAAFNRYPDRDASSLVERIAMRAGRSPDGVWLANGSNEVFMHLFLAFGGPKRKTLVFEPTYSLHSLIPRIAGTGVAAGGRGPGFEIDIAEARALIGRERPDIVIVCSPNNPTGNTETKATIEELLAAAPGLVVVDEAYGEFAPDGSSVVPLLDENDALVVVKTFSKAWSLAGVRLGYLLAAPSLVADLARVRLPYHLSTPTQLFGEAALDHADDMLGAVRSLIEERGRMEAGLGDLDITVHPSSANFVLFEVGDPQSVWDGLLDRGVLVRNYSGAPGLEKCLRVTAGLPEETDAFLSAMKEVA